MQARRLRAAGIGSDVRGAGTHVDVIVNAHGATRAAAARFGDFPSSSYVTLLKTTCVKMVAATGARLSGTAKVFRGVFSP